MPHAQKEEECITEFWWESQKERDHYEDHEDLEVCRRVI
jgi:hypothetical protein